MLETLKTLDEIRLNFSPQGLFMLNIALAFVMFGVALEIKVQHFKNIVLNPKGAIVGFISQFLLLPAITFLTVVLLRNYITPSVALGMILVSACPGGNVSNFITLLARGNAALSVSLTAMATLSAVLLTPFNFAFWGGLYTNYITHLDSQTLLRPLEIDPIQIFQIVFILLGIPLMLGMAVNHRLPVITRIIAKPFKIFSLLLFITMVVLSFSNNYGFFINHIKYIFLIVLLHNGLAFITGYLFARLNRLSWADRRSVTIETGIQNSGLALVLLFNPKIFPPELNIGGMAFIAAWWGIWHILSGLLLAAVWSRRVGSEKEDE